MKQFVTHGRSDSQADNVTFNYDDRITAIRNISFKVPAGHTVALVGASGSGKTTIMRLVFRFYDINSGRILIDGQRRFVLPLTAEFTFNVLWTQAKTSAASHSIRCANLLAWCRRYASFVFEAHGIFC